MRRLEVFGSAARSDLVPDTSDPDFLVEFLPLARGTTFDSYFGLLEDLEVLFQRPVDRVFGSAIRNPYFLESIDRSRTLLYAV